MKNRTFFINENRAEFLFSYVTDGDIIDLAQNCLEIFNYNETI